MTKRREPIPVEKAIQLFDQLGTWERVRQELPRDDGSLFTYGAIVKAVRRHDRRVIHHAQASF